MRCVWNAELSPDSSYGQYVDGQICVFGHGGFVNYMTDQVGATDTRPKVPKLSDWNTGEIRDYKVYDANPGDPAACRLLVRSAEEPLVGDTASANKWASSSRARCTRPPSSYMCNRNILASMASSSYMCI